MNNKSRLISVSASEMARNGYHGFTIDQLITSTGIARSNVYYHFPDKTSLGLSVLDYWSGIYLQLLDNTLENRLLDPDEKIKQLFDRLYQFQIASGYLGEPLTRIATDINNRESLDIYQQMVDHYLNSLGRIFSKEKAAAYFWLGIGTLSACRTFNSVDPLDKLRPLLLSIDFG